MRLQLSFLSAFALFVFFYSCGSTTEKTTEGFEVPAAKKGAGRVVPEVQRVTEFEVDDVKRASSPKKEFPFKMVFEDRISKEVYQMSETDTSAKLVPARMNAFVQCVHDAYAEHRSLTISPDDVWMLIAQGFSIHANEHIDRLESELFVSEKPDTIIVRNDSLAQEAGEAWKSLLHKLSGQVKRYTQPEVYAAMVPTFSTTTVTDRTAYEVAMLETASKVFTYAGESGCGIPSIKLEGTPEDWEALRAGFRKLTVYGLDDWFEGLDPVLQEFVAASKGEVDQAFWQSIYKESIHYTAFFISGWIWKFFPYVKEYSTEPQGNRMMESFQYIPNEYLLGDRYAECTLDTRSFPSGISKVKVLWNIHDPVTGDFTESREMLVHAGFAGVCQDNDLSLSPAIAWAVCFENAEDPEHLFRRKGGDELLEHEEADWVGLVLDNPDVKPIYAPDRNRSYEEGIAFLKKYLVAEVGEGMDGMDISFKVSWMGTVYDVEVAGSSLGMHERLTQLIMTLPEVWHPAESSIDERGFNKDKHFKVNCKVVL